MAKGKTVHKAVIKKILLLHPTDSTLLRAWQVYLCSDGISSQCMIRICLYLTLIFEVSIE
jgi:hypothetical protein